MYHFILNYGRHKTEAYVCKQKPNTLQNFCLTVYASLMRLVQLLQ